VGRDSAHLQLYSVPEDTGAGRRIGVLLAEDDATLRSALVALLESHVRFGVLAAVGDAQEAVAAAAEQRPDVAIVDVRMPNGGGVWAAGEIRRVSPETRVIGYSGHDDPQTAREMADAGAVGYLVKGTPNQVILETIDRVLE
jgi:DNA-binding NarL/FixJ family response regulator